MSTAVCFLIKSLRPGGAERVCVTLANKLCDLGWRISIVVFDLRDATLADELDSRVRVAGLGVRRARDAFRPLLRYLRESRPDVLLVFNYELAIMLVLLRLMFRLDVRLVARNVSMLSAKRAQASSLWHGTITHLLTRLLYRGVDVVIAQSEAMRGDLIENYRIPGGKVRVINNPLPDRFECASDVSAREAGDRRHEILFVGRLTPEKDLSLLIAAFAVCAAASPGLMLRIVGDGVEGARLRALVSTRSLDDRVVYEGFRKCTLPYYRQAKVVVLTSIYEGFPNVLLEALSQGTPVVSVDCPSGPAEIVEDGVNGYLESSRDPVRLAEKILRAVLQDWDRAAVSRSARPYTSAGIVKKYAAVLSAS